MTVFAKNGSPVGSGFSSEINGLNAGEECELIVTLPSVRLAPGSYYCGVSVGRGSHRSTNVDFDVVTDTLMFEVSPERTSVGSMASWTAGWGPISFPELIVQPMSKQVQWKN
jgi:hypothetical protein